MTLQQILAATLVAQLALGAVTWWPSGSTPAEPVPLVQGGAESITGLVVQRGTDGDPVELRKVDGTWTVASAHGYPANVQKLDEVLEILADVQLRSPIATHASSHEALSLTATEFGKKVTVSTAAGDTEVLISSASSKAIHLRKADEDAVYKVRGPSEWSIRDGNKSYLPANHLDLSPDDLVEFTLTNANGRVSFMRTEPEPATEGAPALKPASWTIAGLPEGGIVDTDAIDTLLKGALKVRLQEPQSDEALPAHGLDGTLRVDWVISEDATNVPGGYVVGAEDASYVYLKSSESPFVITTPKKLRDDLSAASAGDFFSVPPPVE